MEESPEIKMGFICLFHLFNSSWKSTAKGGGFVPGALPDA